LEIPVDKIRISQLQVPNKLLTDDEINVDIASGYYETAGVMKYQLANYCAQDLQIAKTEIGKKIINKQSISGQEEMIVNLDLPPVVFGGNYPVTASYILPGKNIITSNVAFNMYNPINN
jgi:hypothetical protein